MDFGKLHFGSIAINGVTYEHDVVIDRGKIRKRKKKPSRNSASSSDTPQSQPRRRHPGGAGAS